jgi:succinate dehydrogenase/fumarate reductase flavoprotein subunit
LTLRQPSVIGSKNLSDSDSQQKDTEMQEFDVMVIGGGASGLRAAIAAKRAGASVGLISKVHPLRTNSAIAQGGLNAPLGKDDSPDSLAADTFMSGDELCDRGVVKAFAQEASKEVVWLERMGVPFNRDKEGRLDLRGFGSNSRNRTCYADDRTGYIVLQVLHEQFQREQIPSFEEWYVTSLAVDGGNCIGAIALGLRGGKLESFSARSVVLATGGFGRLYLPSTASLTTTGDGQCLAYDAGARLMDMEMIQFHPTVFAKKQGLLITEAVLSEGAVIVDQKGAAITDPKGMPRHKISLAIHHAMQNGGGAVSLDLRPIGKEKLRAYFPQTQELVRTVAGLDATKDLVPIRPAAHRPMGGIETNAAGESALAGLFAVGECACNGLNGAGRLAGNTLSEAMVFGRTVGEAAAKHATTAAKKNFPAAMLADEEKQLATISSGGASNDTLGKIHGELGSLMNEKVGLVRTGTGLQEALGQIQTLKERYTKVRVKNPSRIYNYELTAYLELGSMLTLAEVVASAAVARTESRGAHQRADFPARDNTDWKSHTVASCPGGSRQLQKKPVATG